jgi:hypothetical protein
MNAATLLAVLALGTLGAVTVFGYLSAVRTAERLGDPRRPRSTLAADAPDRAPPGERPAGV